LLIAACKKAGFLPLVTRELAGSFTLVGATGRSPLQGLKLFGSEQQMIRRLKVRGYKSLKDVEVYFEPLSVIFGPNAAGKSNLLDALNMISRIVTRKNLKEAFEGQRGLPLERVSTMEKQDTKNSWKMKQQMLTLKLMWSFHPASWSLWKN
jgi:hypothetical protein